MRSPLNDVRVWFRQQKGGEGRAADDPLSVLRQAGLNVYTLDHVPPVGPGLYFFDTPSDAVVEDIRACSRGGFGRVLAVARTSRPLSPADAWRLAEAGASDVVLWSDLPSPAEVVSARLKRWCHIDRLIESPLVRTNLVGRSRVWMSVLRQVVEIAHFSEASVLILGESGTGKELVARLQHTLDPRPEKRELVVLDCTTVVPDLSGSEFFGHEKGAFTGAIKARDGAFALACGGTLFLDEVGELPTSLQSELLRVVQEGTYKRVGSNTWRETSFRLVCATNRNLMEEVTLGGFRRDLYYRIACWTIELPPLRKRREDIIPLAEHFLRQMSEGRDPPEIDQAVREHLLTRDYPGNVRELRQLVRRMAWRHAGPGPITIGDLLGDADPGRFLQRTPWKNGALDQAVRSALARGVGLKKISKAAADAAVRIAVEDAGGNLQQAAQRLGVTDRALQMRRASQERGAAPTNGVS